MRVWVTAMALVTAVVIVACGDDGRVALPVATATPGPSPTAVVTPTPRTPTSQPAPTPVPLETLFEQAKASVQERGYDLTDYTFTVDQQGRRVLALSSRCHFPPGLDISMLANPGFPCSTTHFFLEDQYLGTDTFYTYLGTGSLMPSDPGQFRIGYTTYAPGDPRCCPSVWDEVVYTWDGQKLNASGEPPSPFGKPFSETGTPTHLEGWQGWAKANGWNVQQPAPPPVEEQPPVAQEEPPPPTPEPSQPTSTPPPTQEPSSPPQGTDSARCQAWIDAGLPPDDLEGASACITFLTAVCLAYLSDPSVAGGAEACQSLDILLADHSQPPGGTEGQGVVESCVDDEFSGWSGDTVFELCNGQVWMQASYDYLYHYAYRPDVTIVSTEEGYRMFVEGVSDSILVTQVTDFIRTCIDGDFEGWEGDTIFVLCNGQVWQQASYDYTYRYRYRPDVLIYQAGFGYRMKVEGVDETIRVVRLE